MIISQIYMVVLKYSLTMMLVYSNTGPDYTQMTCIMKLITDTTHSE